MSTAQDIYHSLLILKSIEEDILYIEPAIPPPDVMNPWSVRAYNLLIGQVYRQKFVVAGAGFSFCANVRKDNIGAIGRIWINISARLKSSQLFMDQKSTVDQEEAHSRNRQEKRGHRDAGSPSRSDRMR